MESVHNALLKTVCNVMVDHPEAANLQDLFSNDVYMQIVFNTIMSYIFSVGIVLKKNKGGDLDALKVLARERWDPFLRHALAHLYIYGYVVWKNVEKKDSRSVFSGRPIVYPVVVNRALYDIRIVTDNDLSIK